MSVLGEKAFLANKKEDMIEAILACKTVEELVKKAQEAGVELPLETAEEFFDVVHKPDFDPEKLEDSELNGCGVFTSDDYEYLWKNQDKRRKV